MALGSSQPLTGMSTRNLPGGKGPRRLTTLPTFTACYRDSFTLLYPTKWQKTCLIAWLLFSWPKIPFFWDVTPYKLIYIYLRFGRKYCLHPQGRRINRPSIYIFFLNFHSGGWSPNWVHSARRPFQSWPIVPAPGDCEDGEFWWNEWQGKPKYSKKTCPGAILSTTNSIWPDPGLNLGRRGGKPATNRLSYGAADQAYKQAASDKQRFLLFVFSASFSILKTEAESSTET
jgi:hypothetical protein